MTKTQPAIIAASVVCLLLASCGGLTTAEPDQPAEAVEVVEAPEPEPTDYLAKGKAEGYSAAVAAQTATGNDWNDVGLGWDAAMRSLDKVPADSPDYAEAQTKLQEYTANREVASVRYNAHLAEVKARQAPAPVKSTSQSTEKTLEEKMALIDGLPGYENTYARLLDQIGTKCTQSRTEIGDIAARSVEVAAQYGHKTNILDMLEAGHIATRSTDFQLDCVEIFSLIVTMMDAQ